MADSPGYPLATLPIATVVASVSQPLAPLQSPPHARLKAVAAMFSLLEQELPPWHEMHGGRSSFRSSMGHTACTVTTAAACTGQELQLLPSKPSMPQAGANPGLEVCLKPLNYSTKFGVNREITI